MSETKNVQIPYEIFMQLYDIVDYIDISNYDESIKTEFENIVDFLREKKKSMEKRELYKNLVSANKLGNEDEQFNSRIKYLAKKRDIDLRDK